MGGLDEEILEIRPHDHLCLIYERESEWRPAAEETGSEKYSASAISLLPLQSK